jgi:hypothetical protein
MRYFALVVVALLLAAPAAAATPRFGLFDLGADAAKASHNVYGDVQVAASRAALARKAHGATLVRCAAGCRLGRGWLAFAKAPSLTRTDLGGAKASLGQRGWTVSVALTARGQARWKRLAAQARRSAARSGLPPVYAVVVDGSILALPFANELRVRKGTLSLVGFTKAGAKLAVQSLRG